MATAYSSNLALALPVTGELSGTWGTTVNTEITNMLDEALGYQAYSATGGADTITIPNGTTGVARSIYIQLNGTGGGSVAVPTTKTKMYFVFNNTASAITFKVTGQTGVSIPAAAKMALVSNGTDIIVAENYFSALTLGAALPVASGGTSLTTLTANNVILGNGASAPTFVAPSTSGNVLTSNGTTWSSTAPATSGTVTSVAMTVPSVLSISGSPITSSGTLALTYSGTALPVANGGTGITSFGTGVATALGVNVGTAGAFVVNGGALGSPSSVGTMPAFTLGGTVSGGGNQINNVVIGTTTPLAGSFTTLSATGLTTLGNASGQNGVFDAVVGNADATTGDNTGLVIVSNTTGTGWLGFNNGNSAGIPGQVTYNHSTNTMNLYSSGPITFQPSGGTASTLSSTGLAVTGTLSATGAVEPANYINIRGAQNGNNAKLAFTRTDRSWSITNETNLRFYTQATDTVSPSTQVAELTSTGLAVTGTLSATTPIGTASGGTGLGGATPFTSTGVVFASSSSALATGSALTFDGTSSLTLNASAATVNLGITTNYAVVTASGTNPAAIYFNGATRTSFGSFLQYGATNHVFLNETLGAELMRILNTGNVGIGTSSPTRILELSTGTPAIALRASGQAADQKYWEFSVSGTVLRGGVQNDANTTEAFWMEVQRGAGNAVTSVAFPISNLIVSTGNVVIGTAGKGIDFSADPSAPGMTSELLDDYEEGTWTPTQGTLTVVGAFSSAGTYTKVGNLVTVTGTITGATSVAGAGGAASYFSGLPFVPVAGSSYAVGTNVGTYNTVLSFLIGSDGNAYTIVTIPATPTMGFSVTYRT